MMIRNVNSNNDFFFFFLLSLKNCFNVFFTIRNALIYVFNSVISCKEIVINSIGAVNARFFFLFIKYFTNKLYRFI